jgi:hypothetical protein
MRPIKTSLPGWYRLCLRSERKTHAQLNISSRRVDHARRKDTKDAKKIAACQFRMLFAYFATFASLLDLTHRECLTARLF